MLAAAAFSSLTATAATALSQWVVLALCARWAGPQALGELAWAAALVLPLHLVAGLQQRTALGTGAPGDTGSHLRLRLATALVVGLVVAAWVLVAGLPPAAAQAALWLAAARGAEGLGEVALGRLQRAERFAAIAVLQSVRAACIAGGAALGVVWWGTATGAAAGWCAGSLVALLLAELPQLRRDRTATTPLPPWPLFLRLWPLGLSLGLVAWVGAIPRLVLGEMQGTHALAVYAAAAVVAALVAQAAGAAAPGVSTRIAGLHDAAAIRSLQRRLMLVAVGLALVAAVGAWCCGGWALALVFGPAFAGAGPLLAGLCLATALDVGAMAAGTVLTARGVWLPQVPLLGVAMLVSWVVAVATVPIWDAWGAVAALASAHLVRWVWAEVLVARTLSSRSAPAAAAALPPPR